MKKVLFVAGALAFATLPALAQSGPDERGSGSDRGRDPGSWRDPGAERPWRDDSSREGGWRGGDRGGWREMRGEGRGMAGGPRRGARFMVRSGDAAVAVRCDPNESMRSCLDATLTLLDRARASSAGGSAPGPGTGSGSGSAQPRQ